MLPALRCYTEGLTHLVEEGITANETAIVQATSKIDEFDIRAMHLFLQNNRLEIENINVQRSRDTSGTAPLALLSYKDIVSMKPGSRSRHDLSNKEWGKFEEKSKRVVCRH